MRKWKLSGYGLAAGLLLLLFQNFSIPEMNAQTNNGEEALDFVIMNVCVDSLDRPVAGDPATCANQRNIRIGEYVPYIRTDFGPNGGRYQAVTSYPIPGSDGTMKIMVGKHMYANFTAQYQFAFDQYRDGFDLIEVNGNYISGARTSDPGCYDQMMNDDGWVFFDRSNHWGSSHLPITITRLTPKPGCDATSSGFAYTVWDRVSLTYTSGKYLDTIESYHFAQQNLSLVDNALEKFYFTKQYGFTRWEAWIPRERCLNDFRNTPQNCEPAATAARCNGTTSELIGGIPWVRVDCRDSTNYLAVNTPFIPFTDQMAASSVDYAAAYNAVKVGDYVRELYRLMFGREADAGGFMHFQNQLLTGAMTSLQFHQTLSYSAEANSKINDLYIQILNRPGDAAGIAGFQGVMASGGYLATVRQMIANSAESAEKVRTLYRQILDREPSAAEVQNVQNGMASGKRTFVSVRNDFGMSLEAENKIKKFYTTILERDADVGGLNTYKNSLSKGTLSLAQVRNALANSAEATQKIYRLALQHLGRTAQTVTLDIARASWQPALVGGSSLADIRKTFAQSEEGKQYIVNVFSQSLGRAPRSAELDAWVYRNANNMLNILQIKQIINNSPEAMVYRNVMDRVWLYSLVLNSPTDYLHSMGNAMEGYAQGYRYNGVAFQVYRENATGRAGVYRCLNLETKKHFLSLKTNCEGQVNEGVIGYLPQAVAGAAKKAIYRCQKDYFLYTTDQARCAAEGLTVHSILGYTL